MTAWERFGVPKAKILVNFPTYGHTFNLNEPLVHGIGAPSNGFSLGSDEIRYATACSFIQNGAARVFEQDKKVPYAYHAYSWISYDDEVSFQAKCSWLKSKGYAGATTFTLNADDWSGTYRFGRRFPLD